MPIRSCPNTSKLVEYNILLLPQDRQTPLGDEIVGVTKCSEHLQAGVGAEGVYDGVRSIFGFTLSSTINRAFLAAIEASFPSKSFLFLLLLPTCFVRRLPMNASYLHM